MSETMQALPCTPDSPPDRRLKFSSCSSRSRLTPARGARAWCRARIGCRVRVLSARLSDAIETCVDAGASPKRISAMRCVRCVQHSLEADVALPVVTGFVERRPPARPWRREVSRSLTPGQAFIKIVHDSLVAVMGEQFRGARPCVPNLPAVVMLAGLQGSGKTTTAAKLARRLIERDRKKVPARQCRRPSSGGDSCSSSDSRSRSAPSSCPVDAGQCGCGHRPPHGRCRGDDAVARTSSSSIRPGACTSTRR